MTVIIGGKSAGDEHQAPVERMTIQQRVAGLAIAEATIAQIGDEVDNLLNNFAFPPGVVTLDEKEFVLLLRRTNYVPPTVGDYLNVVRDRLWERLGMPFGDPRRPDDAIGSVQAAYDTAFSLFGDRPFGHGVEGVPVSADRREVSIFVYTQGGLCVAEYAPRWGDDPGYIAVRSDTYNFNLRVSYCAFCEEVGVVPHTILEGLLYRS